MVYDVWNPSCICSGGENSRSEQRSVNARDADTGKSNRRSFPANQSPARGSEDHSSAGQSSAYQSMTESDSSVGRDWTLVTENGDVEVGVEFVMEREVSL